MFNKTTMTPTHRRKRILLDSICEKFFKVRYEPLVDCLKAVSTSSIVHLSFLPQGEGRILLSSSQVSHKNISFGKLSVSGRKSHICMLYEIYGQSSRFFLTNFINDMQFRTIRCNSSEFSSRKFQE